MNVVEYMTSTIRYTTYDVGDVIGTTLSVVNNILCNVIYF